ncbi:hypothetical protein AaE_012455 [Aphanomyces astaci]|uniref:Uncharacterized protein n=1 Tax=Aphanomyces astaci TaxID=112090 RepID=A0A6A4ZG49_APHAT|nr:hypothetical protein AaE_012455 [Aphanomyces astaci]
MAKIKEQKPSQSFWMDVYLMKRNGKWLKSGDPDAQEFMRLGQSNGIRAMMKKHGAMHPLTDISDPAIGFPDTEAIEDDDIHVFVHTQSPDARRRTSKLQLDFVWTNVLFVVSQLSCGYLANRIM